MNLIVFDRAEWGQPLPDSDERAVHIREVLRLEPGDQLRVGLLGVGAGLAVFRGEAASRLVLEFPAPADLAPDAGPLPVTVLLGQPRPPVMQRLLKDLGALGVARILVVSSELSEKSYMQSRVWHGHDGISGTPLSAGATGIWRNHLVAGAQQGGHCFLAETERFYSVNKAIDGLESATAAVPLQRLVLDLAPGSASLLTRCAAVEGRESSAAAAQWCLAIGPERGWSERERGLFAELGFAPFSLGPRILRTETATILATGMLALALGGQP